MGVPFMTVTGRVMGAVVWRPTPAGLPIVTIKIKAVDRYEDEEGVWQDGAEYVVIATAYKDLAIHINESIHAGDMVVVIGRMETQKWHDTGGRLREQDMFILTDCGPSLKFARRRHEHIVRAEIEAELREMIRAELQAEMRDGR